MTDTRATEGIEPLTADPVQEKWEQDLAITPFPSRAVYDKDYVQYLVMRANALTARLNLATTQLESHYRDFSRGTTSEERLLGLRRVIRKCRECE